MKKKQPELKNLWFVPLLTYHVSLATEEKLLVLDWDIVCHIHPTVLTFYSEASDYCSQNFLNNKQFNDYVGVNLYLIRFFDDKNQNLYESGKMMLLKR